MTVTWEDILSDEQYTLDITRMTAPVLMTPLTAGLRTPLLATTCIRTNRCKYGRRRGDLW